MSQEHYELWERESYPSKRESRRERKMKSAKDRSKYKKTDQMQRSGQQERSLEALLERLTTEPSHVKKALVSLIRSQEVHLLIDGVEALGRLRGVMKHEQEENKNLVVVGDEVVVSFQEDGTWSIEAVLPRRSILSRQDNLNRIKRHLIAANVDQVFITVSIVCPHLRPSIIDRYVIAAKKGELSPILLINKVDLLDQADGDERSLFEHVCEEYPKVGIPVIPFSALSLEGKEMLENAMKGHISVFSGQSGTGKSSLINALLGTSFRVGETVGKTKKGSHTTTFAQLVELPSGGMCIDTPGIKSFGIWDLTVDDIREGFPELQTCRAKCQFADCWHRGEQGCGVVLELEQEIPMISPIRYYSYLSLLDEMEEERKRR